MADRLGKPMSQRQLRVGEMVKQALSMIFIKNEAKVPNLETNNITVDDVIAFQKAKADYASSQDQSIAKQLEKQEQVEFDSKGMSSE